MSEQNDQAQERQSAVATATALIKEGYLLRGAHQPIENVAEIARLLADLIHQRRMEKIATRMWYSLNDIRDRTGQMR
jgi:heme oxygenase